MKNPAFIRTLTSVLTIIAVFLAATVQAHTPYLVPTSFDPVMGGMVTLDASFAERFFVPEAAFNNSEFQVTAPDGQSTTADSVVTLKTRLVVEHKLQQEGTYRLTTGARMGAEFVIYELDGKEKRAMDSSEPLPEGANIKRHFRSVTRADTYVTRKKPNHKALKVESSGLQILPVTHPNSLFADEAFSLKVIFEGKPLVAEKLLAYRAEGELESKPLEFEANDKGVVHMTLPAGKYLLRARHRAPAPKTAKVPTYSHTTTLSILVFDNI